MVRKVRTNVGSVCVCVTNTVTKDKGGGGGGIVRLESILTPS